MKAVYALFTGPEAAQQAVDALRSAGAADHDIVVMSSEPFEEFEFSHRDKATWLHWIAGAGGVVGLTAGYFLTTTTQQLWPLRTSGMPIVATWPNTIVVFEMTMLGAIVATVVALFITAKLPSRLPRLYDSAVSDGYILVGVNGPAEALAPRLEEALATVPGGQVKTIA